MSTEATPARKSVRTLTGQVVSDKMDKTIAVAIERVVRHPTVLPIGRMAHQGDTVSITPCRPLSRHKSWRLLAVIERAVAG
jgi:small subunit ribosomal protein S17